MSMYSSTVDLGKLATLAGIFFFFAFTAHSLLSREKVARPKLKSAFWAAVFVVFTAVAWHQHPLFGGEPFVMIGAPLAWLTVVWLAAKIRL